MSFFFPPQTFEYHILFSILAPFSTEQHTAKHKQGELSTEQTYRLIGLPQQKTGTSHAPASYKAMVSPGRNSSVNANVIY